MFVYVKTEREENTQIQKQTFWIFGLDFFFIDPPWTSKRGEDSNSYAPITLCVYVNWHFLCTSDLQPPAQLAPALGAVATRKTQTAGEEQAKTRMQGEATPKPSTTSEYSNSHKRH